MTGSYHLYSDMKSWTCRRSFYIPDVRLFFQKIVKWLARCVVLACSQSLGWSSVSLSVLKIRFIQEKKECISPIGSQYITYHMRTMLHRKDIKSFGLRLLIFLEAWVSKTIYNIRIITFYEFVKISSQTLHNFFICFVKMPYRNLSVFLDF